MDSFSESNVIIIQRWLVTEFLRTTWSLTFGLRRPWSIWPKVVRIYVYITHFVCVCSTPGFTPSCTQSRDSRLSAMQPWTKLSWTLATPFTYYVRHLRRRGVLCCDCSILFSGWANTCNLDSKLLCGGQEPYTINSYRYEIPSPPAIPLYIYNTRKNLSTHFLPPSLFNCFHRPLFFLFPSIIIKKDGEPSSWFFVAR